VAKDLHLEYIQRRPDGAYALRLAETFRLRVKQPDAIQTLEA
jgi:hypothetical protein